MGEISLYELLRAYTVFSDGGHYCDFTAVPVVSDSLKLSATGVSNGCKKRADPSKVAEIFRILTNRGFKLREFGTDTALDFQDRTVFVKTGTSRNFRDNYAVGFSRNFLLAVWSGNKDGSNMKGVSGATGAGEIFSRIIREIEEKDDAPKEEKLVAEAKGYLRILSPLDGSRYQFDPTVPERLQSVTVKFSTDIAFDSVEWKLDGTALV